MKKVLVSLILVTGLVLGGCSTSVDVKEGGREGTCIHERSRKVVGITYSKSETFVSCDE